MGIKLIDLSKYKVIYKDTVTRAVSLMRMEFEEGNFMTDNEGREYASKPIFIEVLVIDSDGTLEVIGDEASAFQFIPILATII